MKYTKPLVVIALIVLAGTAGAMVLKPQFSNVKSESSQVRESYTAMLSPDQEIMMATSTTQASSTSTVATTSPTSNGVGNSFFNLLDTNNIVYRVEVSNLTSPIIGAHLHCAAVGQNGQIIVPLVASSTSGTGVGSSKAILSGTITEGDITAAAMSCNPNIKSIAHLTQAIREGMIYVNVHTEHYPNGEVRGQLLFSNQIINFDGTATSTVATTTPTNTATSTATSTNGTGTSTDNNTGSSTGSTGSNNGTSTSGNTGETTSPTGWYYVFAKPDAYYKIQGSSVTFTGSHFVPGETVTIVSGGSSVGTVTADSSGNFTTQAMTVPYGTGMRTYTFTGASSQLSFPVQIHVGSGSPWITLSTYYAAAGAPVTITGQQFGANENVTVWFNGINMGTAQTNSEGTFSLNSTVPSSGQGQWTVTATGATTKMTASQPFSQSQ